MRTSPYYPQTKGKVERGIAYVKSNALKGREFDSLAAQNEHLKRWEQHVADLSHARLADSSQGG